MKDGLTTQVVVEAGPMVVGTVLKHYLEPRRAKQDDENQETARVEFMYDEAFNIAKMFLDVSTQHTADALQKFSQTRTPSPPWVAVHRLSIPEETSSLAAKFLVEALGGKEMAYKIAGGSTWWQVRAGAGVECEWIAMKKIIQKSDREDAYRAKQQSRHDSVDSAGATNGSQLADEEQRAGDGSSPYVEGDNDADGDSGFIPAMDKTRCMLYIHGGGYYWGSINTHRYLMWRFARKIHGRVFAVNYRKAPQYPFPCAIQDVLSAYLYLVNPPAGSPHRPVDPKNIVLAGDSAGGGLVWSLLQILRDTPGLELPAGAVLISPWSDLTHSFPSILKNTKTDVLPPYSFIHKPSSLWPPPPPELTKSMKTKIVDKGTETLSSPPLVPPPRNTTGEIVHTSDPEAYMKLKSIINPGKDAEREPVPSAAHMSQSFANPAAVFANLAEPGEGGEHDPECSLASCDDSLRVNARGMDIVIDTQIQLYARNSQLCHPYISPALGYLGGLPPIYVMAGNSEVLRDEILYAAHKAAHPEQHPIRDDVRKLLPSLEGIEERYGPTDVHLQVYDGVGHDLPLFSMTKPARGVIRAISTFTRHVTPLQGATGSETPMGATPPVESDSTPRAVPAAPFVDSPIPTPPSFADGKGKQSLGDTARLDRQLQRLKMEQATQSESETDSDLISTPVSRDSASSDPSVESLSTTSAPAPKPKHSRGSSLSSFFLRKSTPASKESTADTAKSDSGPGPGEAGWPGIYAGNPYEDHMIRERVNFTGKCRPLEPEAELDAMIMPVDEIGMVKEGPALRYVEGQALWDKKFKHTRKRIARHRRRNLAKAKDGDAKQLKERWSKIVPEQSSPSDSEVSSDEDALTWCDRNAEHIAMDASWAWQWALEGDQPPPSAIVGRRDLPEGRKTALQADRIDTTDDGKMHALSVWVLLAQVFSGGSEKKKASEAWKEAKAMHRGKEAKAMPRGKEKQKLRKLFS